MFFKGALDGIKKSILENYFKGYLDAIDEEEYEKALDFINKIININPHDKEVYYNKANVLFDMENFDEAEKCVDKALEIDPNDTDALNLKGVILLDLDKKYQSINYFDKALVIDSNYFFALKNKGIALYNLDKHKEALETIDNALKLENGDVDLLNYKGIVLNSMLKFNEALNWYDKALKIDNTNVWSMYLKAITLYNLDMLKESINWLNAALNIDPRYLDALNLKGELCRKNGKYETSLECLNKIIKIDPEYVDAWFELGNVYKDLRRTDNSIRAYEKFIQAVRKNKLSDRDNQVLRTNEYLNWVKENEGETVTFSPRKKPQYWQWITRSEYFLDKDGNERKVLEPGISLDPGSYWTCHKDTLAGDLILLYRAGKKKGVTYQDVKYVIMARSDAYPLDIWEIDEDSWRYGCDYITLFKFKNSLKLSNMKEDPYLEGWNALNANFNMQVYSTKEKYWKRLNDLLSDLNPDYKEFLSKFDRKKIIAKIKTENEFETELIKNIHVMKKFGYELEVLGRQVHIGTGGFIDILCKDKNNEEYVIIELKIEKAKRDDFGQISEYIGWVMEHKAENKPIKSILISRGQDSKFLAALKTNPNIETIELKEVLSELGMKLK